MTYMHSKSAYLVMGYPKHKVTEKKANIEDHVIREWQATACTNIIGPAIVDSKIHDKPQIGIDLLKS